MKSMSTYLRCWTQAVGASAALVRRDVRPLLALVTSAALLATLLPGCANTSGPNTRYEYSRIQSRSGFANPAQESAPQIEVDGPWDEVWVITRREREGDRPAPQDPRELPGIGSLISTEMDASGAPMAAFPLQSTDVTAQLDGPLATVRVAQVFANPFVRTIEAAYVFPLPHDAAVADFTMRVGERQIRGIVRERAEAERIYRDARSRGYVASLLAEERPNIFMERVANIEPGRSVEVELTYFNMLQYADGWYEWRFPLVVGPRYNPPATPHPIPALPLGGSANEGRVQGVEYLAPGEGSGHSAGIHVAINAGVPIEEITSTSHALAPIERSREVTRVRLAARDREVNRDFVLRYRVGGREQRYGVISGLGADGRGTFAMTIYPPVGLGGGGRMPVDLVFVVDRSGSMAGPPLEQAKRAMSAALGRLGPEDRFQIVDFGSEAAALGSELLWASRATVEGARRYLESMQAGGGTRVLSGLARALAFPKADGRVQYLVFLGDGFVSNEAEITAELARSLGDRRVFALGVGSSVNWHLTHELARVGRGAVASIDIGDDPTPTVERFMDLVSAPLMQSARLEWSGVRVSETWPRSAPDLLPGRPVTVLGRYDSPGSGTATIRGYVRGATASVSVPIALSAMPNDGALDRLWARAKIAELAAEANRGERSERSAREEILSTAIRHGISSPFTAFIAVDGSRVTQGTDRTTIVQPVAMPAGVRYDTTVPPGRGS